MKTSTILRSHPKRPWSIPQQKWEYYQEWNDVLFLHFIVSFDELRSLVPENLILDDFNQQYFVSIVCFKMEKIRPINFPSFPLISDFHEINIRTYIKNDDKPGVYFLSIEAAKTISAKIAKILSGLPYEKSNIKRTSNAYINLNKRTNNTLNISFKVEEKLAKDAMKDWLTERYCLYLEQNKNLFRYEIQHQEWELNNTEILEIKLNYKIGNLNFSGDNLYACQYAKGVKVLSWPKEKLIPTISKIV